MPKPQRGDMKHRGASPLAAKREGADAPEFPVAPLGLGFFFLAVPRAHDLGYYMSPPWG